MSERAVLLIGGQMKSRPLRILFGAGAFGMIGLFCGVFLSLVLMGPDAVKGGWHVGYWVGFAIGLPISIRYMK